MKWTTTTALILAAGAGALWVNHLLTPTPEDPRALLQRLASDERAGGADQREALRRLTAAIDGNQENLADAELGPALLRARSAAYRGMGSYSSAREDLERILSTWLPGNRDLELEASELTALEGLTDTALQRVRRLVARDPSSARAFELVGRLERSLADEHLARAIRLCDDSIDSTGARRSARILREYAARGDGDPRSAELLAELRAIFRPHESAPFAEVLELARTSSEASARALDAYSKSMALGPSDGAVVEVARALDAVSRSDRAADLLLASRAMPELNVSPAIVTAMLPILERTGRSARARDIVMRWDWDWGGDLEFYRLAATVLYQAGQFGGVNRAAQGMRAAGGVNSETWRTFFLCANSINVLESYLARDPNYGYKPDDITKAATQLVSFARKTSEPEPFEGARTAAWFVIARAHRLLGLENEERVALATGVPLSPNATAADWARLAELEGRGIDPAWERVEVRLTQALNAEPLRTPEYFERWLAAGESALASDGLELKEVIAECSDSPDGQPLRSVGPSVLWRIAEAHLREGRSLQAQAVADQLLQTYPRLVPALDTLIQSQFLYAAPTALRRRIMERIELVGADARTESFLAKLAEPLAGPELQRAMRASPERFGRPAAAQLALAEGDFERAAAVLDPVTAVEYSPELRRTRAETRARAGRLADAAQDFTCILDDPLHGDAALIGLVDVRLREGDRGAVDALVAEAARRLLRPEQRLQLVRSLARRNRLDLAQDVLGQLDQSAAARTPDFYRELVLCASQLRDTGTLNESIARAEPYLEDGTPELAELLQLVRNRDWTALPAAAARLRASTIVLTPLQEACLTLLEERLAHGRRLAERSVAAQPRSPEWALVRAASLALEGEPIELGPWFGSNAAQESTETLLGSRRGRRDPRETLVILLVLERDEWLSWVATELRALNEQRAGLLWPQWLGLRVAQRRGETHDVEQAIAGLERDFSGFGPAWDLHLQSVAARHHNDPLANELLQLRVARLAALGVKVVDDAVELALARASAEILAGSDQPAVAKLGEALNRERRLDFEARFTLGALLARAGQYGIALPHLRDAASNAPQHAAHAVADAYIDAILRASSPAFAQRAPLAPEEVPDRLQELVRTFPTDPAVALALIRYGGSANRGPSQRASAARLELARLRRESGGRSLEALRPGSTRAWVELTLELGPEFAREIVDAELALRPGDVDLWEYSARIAESIGDANEAEALYRTALAIEQRAGAAHALAELLVERGAPVAEIEELLRIADSLRGPGRSSRSRLLVTQMRMRQAIPQFATVASELRGLWDRRDANDATLQPRDVGFALVTTYIQWVTDLDRQRSAAINAGEAGAAALAALPVPSGLAAQAAEVLDQLAPRVGTDPFELALFESYRGIVKGLASTNP